MIAKDSRFFSTFEHNQMLVQRPLDIWTCTIFVSMCCQFTPKGDVVNHGVDRIPIVAVLSRGSCCFTMRQNDIFTYFYYTNQANQSDFMDFMFTAQAHTKKFACLFTVWPPWSVSKVWTVKGANDVSLCLVIKLSWFFLVGREAYLPGKLYNISPSSRQFWVDDFPFPVWWNVLLPLQAYFKGLSSH